MIAAWSAEAIAGFEERLVRLRHTLAGRAMFSDEGLSALLDRYPRAALGVYTMGDDPEDWRTWRRGAADRMSGDSLLEAVKQGRFWLNLRHVNDHLPEYASLCAEIAAEKERRLKRPILNRDLGVLISSPNARVFYHLDVPLSSLWQVRGEKRIWFYPCRQPFVQPAWLERCVQGVAEGQMPYRAEWDAAAETFPLIPGDMVTWPQNMPHRVDNGPMMNVAVSMEFMTSRARIRANVLRANGVLRAVGWAPRVQDRMGPTLAAKLALARIHRLSRPRRRGPILPQAFALGAGDR